jgi:hypothetical protein
MKLVNVRFGTPEKNCLGHGICAITPWARLPLMSTLSCAPVKTFWILKPEGLIVKVPIAGLSKNILDKHFSSQFFLMENSILLPQFLQDHFKFTESYCIPAGHYKISQNQDFLIIHLVV